MKRYAVLMIVCLVSLLSMNVQAAAGTIEIQLNGATDTKLKYGKVATMINGQWKLDETYKESKVDLNSLENAMQLEVAAKTLMKCENDMQSALFEGNDSIFLENLEEGLYLITFDGNSEQEMKPTLVALPGWTGEEMSYHVKVIPKYREKIKAPLTGQDSRGEVFVVMILISGIIIAGLSCHKYFKCGRIFFKYSNVGGHTDGNDNDTKNPRRARRVRQRGSRSVD